MPRGPLMIIGGAEDKLRRRRILKEFVAASGGPDARIAVIPTASSLGAEIVDVYDALFRALHFRAISFKKLLGFGSRVVRLLGKTERYT